MIEYDILRFIWWVLLGVLLAGVAVMDGFDLGAAALLPWLGRNDNERRVVINCLGPVWESNQVWLVLGGGALFAAWPLVYAVSFSCLYFAMMLVLACLILRPAAFKFRSKLTTQRWRQNWDRVLCFTGLVPALLFGVAVGNVLLGIPFHLDQELRISYSGTFWALLNPYAITCGIISLSMLLMHGSLYIASKTVDPIRSRARSAALLSGVMSVLSFLTAGLMTTYQVKGYRLDSLHIINSITDPLHKQVSQGIGHWMLNYNDLPWLWLVPSLAVIGAILAILLRNRGESKLAFTASGLSIICIVATTGVGMFPFILPSSAQPQASLTVWDASASQLSLFLMLIATCVLLPILLLYVRWMYKVMRGKVQIQDIVDNSQNLY